jgi:pyridoxal phosphate enzyme (YggS family)
MSVTKARIEKNLARVRETIAAACAKGKRSESEVSIVAVTKSVDGETIRNLADMGLTELGESRVQQLCERAEALASHMARRRTAPTPTVRWHMIGHLQRNKVRAVMDVAGVIHSVDSLRLAEEINARAEHLGRTTDILLQVNCSQETQKFGVAVGAATHLAELISTLRHVRLVGLMTMAALSNNPEDARSTFVRLRELFEEMRGTKIGGEALRHLSMGMSQDYAVAVEEGATLLRIGTALFE